MNFKTDESTPDELREQLTYAELNAAESLRLEWVVSESEKRLQQQRTTLAYKLVESLRIRLSEKLS